jgi:hypothetical protein
MHLAHLSPASRSVGPIFGDRRKPDILMGDPFQGSAERVPNRHHSLLHSSFILLPSLGAPLAASRTAYAGLLLAGIEFDQAAKTKNRTACWRGFNCD